MKRSLFFLFLLACLTANILAAGTDDNIYIAERIVTCRLSARDGRVSGARISQNYRIGARRVAGTGMVIAFYDRNSTVDHAGATGGKPQYRAWENGEGDIVVQCALRIKTANVPLQYRPMLRDLYDAAAAFADAALVFVKA